MMLFENKERKKAVHINKMSRSKGKRAADDLDLIGCPSSL